jgi:WD40 repeat protein
VYSVDFSLDGKVLASGSGDGTIKLWDVGTGTEIKTLPNDEAYHMISVAFSPDGKIVASGSDSTIKLWDVNTGTEIKTLGHRWFVGSVEFSPDGKVLASGLCDGIKLWDVDSGTEIRTFPYYGSSLAFSPNGKVLASQIGDEDVILCHLYDEEDEEALEILGDSHYKLNLNQKMLLYVLHVNKKAAEKENPVKCKVKLQETEEEMKAGFADKPVPSMLNLAESYRSLPESLRKVVKDYFKVIE